MRPRPQNGPQLLRRASAAKGIVWTSRRSEVGDTSQAAADCRMGRGQGRGDLG
jgi:hypothetical protein